MTRMLRTRKPLLAALTPFLAACAMAPSEPQHDDPSLPLVAGERVDVRTDLADPKDAVARLDRMEGLLDEAFPWLPAPPGRTRVLLLADTERFREVARSHEVPEHGGATAFACTAGEVVILYRPDEWGAAANLTWLDMPRSAPVAEAVFRQRLEANMGKGLQRTRIEDGLARIFSGRVAHTFGEALEADRRDRDDLVNAYLPIFLDTDPEALVRSARARGSEAEVHGSRSAPRVLAAPAAAYAVARFLLEADKGKRAGLVKLLLQAASGDVASEADWEKEQVNLAQDSEAYARWLRQETEVALLAGIATDPVPAARWDAQGALHLISGILVDADAAATKEARASAVERARDLMSRAGTVRFVEEFDAPLAVARDHHRPGDLEGIVRDARALLDERARGYAHPALEEARASLGKALEERLKEL